MAGKNACAHQYIILSYCPCKDLEAVGSKPFWTIIQISVLMERSSQEERNTRTCRLYWPNLTMYITSITEVVRSRMNAQLQLVLLNQVFLLNVNVLYQHINWMKCVCMQISFLFPMFGISEYLCRKEKECYRNQTFSECVHMYKYLICLDWDSTHTNTIFVILKKGSNGVSQGDSWVFQQERSLCHLPHPAKPIEKACFYPCQCLWPRGEATEWNSQVSCAFQRGGIWTFIALSQKTDKVPSLFFLFVLIFT